MHYLTMAEIVEVVKMFMAKSISDLKLISILKQRILIAIAKDVFENAKMLKLDLPNHTLFST